MSKKRKKTPAASLKSRNNGLGLPIHIKKLPILLNIRYYVILSIYYLYILSIIFNFLLEYVIFLVILPIHEKTISLKNNSLKLKAGFPKNIKNSMNFTFDKWVQNVIPVTNPTQYTKLGKYKVKTPKSTFTPNTPKCQKKTQFAVIFPYWLFPIGWSLLWSLGAS